LFLPALVAGAAAPQRMAHVGDTYEISTERDSSQQSSDGSSSGSSHDRDVLVERVVAVDEAGLELEYDLPKTATAQERASAWQFPVRVLAPIRGPLQLLNGAELEARVNGWLKAGHMTRAACGHWIFTWNAFRIECDPASVLKALAIIDLRSEDMRDGASYQDPAARAAAPLTLKTAGPGGATFAVAMTVDPAQVYRARAQSDIVVAEILRKNLTLEAALSARSAEHVSGTINITFETDSTGHVWRRTRVTRLETGQPGKLETETTTETVTRRPISSSNL
jgi:hypothetical protein